MRYGRIITYNRPYRRSGMPMVCIFTQCDKLEQQHQQRIRELQEMCVNINSIVQQTTRG